MRWYLLDCYISVVPFTAKLFGEKNGYIDLFPVGLLAFSWHSTATASFSHLELSIAKSSVQISVFISLHLPKLSSLVSWLLLPNWPHLLGVFHISSIVQYFSKCQGAPGLWVLPLICPPPFSSFPSLSSCFSSSLLFIHTHSLSHGLKYHLHTYDFQI